MGRNFKLKINNEKDITYKKLHEMYIKKCIVNNISPYSVNNYNNNYKVFNNFVNLDNLKCKKINNELIDNFKLFLKGKNLADSSINSYIKYVRIIVNYGIKLGYISDFSITEIKEIKKIKVIYTKEELKILLKKPTLKSFGIYRNWVIINTLLATGIRSLELLNLRIKDLNLEDDLLLVSRAKNKRQRYIPISSALHTILLQYLNVRGGNDEEYLFSNSYAEKLAPSTLRTNIAKYNNRRGVMKTSIHLFRHTFATMYLQNGGDIHTLAKLLGHSTLKQVQTYLNLTNEDIKEKFNEINPLDKISKKQSIRLKKKKRV